MKRFAGFSIMMLLIFFSSRSSAQLSGGIEAAVTTSSVKIADINNDFTDAIKGNSVFGYEAGLFLRASIGPLYVKPKLLLDYQHGTLSYLANETNQNVTFHAGKLVIPVLFGFNFFPALSLEAGPVYNYLLFATKDFNGNHIDLAKSGLGYRIGANVKLGILNITASYQGIKNNGSITSSASYDNPDQFIFGLGLEF